MKTYAYWRLWNGVWVYQTDISGTSPEDALTGVGGSFYMNRYQCVTEKSYLTPDDKSNILAGYIPN